MQLRRRTQSLIVQASLVVLMMTSAAGAAVPKTTPIKDILQPAAKAMVGTHVTIQGTVYYSDPYWNFYFIGDGTGFIFVSRPRDNDLRFGTKVRVHGTVVSGRTQHKINEVTCETLADAPKSAHSPAIVDLHQLRAGEFDACWIETTATVECITLDAERAFFRCLSGTEADKDRLEFTICAVRPAEIPDKVALVGSTIRVRGNLGLSINRLNEIVGLQLFLTGDIETIQPAQKQLIPPKQRTIAEAKTVDESTFSISGQVTYCDQSGFFVEHNQSATWVAWPPTDVWLDPGLKVEVVGFRQVNENGQNELEARYCVQSGYNALLQPKVSSIVSIFRDRPEARRVQVQGAIQRHTFANDSIRLALQSEDSQFVVTIAGTKENYESLNLSSALSATVIGTCTFNVSDPNHFAMFVPSVADVQITQRQSSVSRNKVLIAILTAVGLFALGLVWGKSLRHQVRTKTSALSRMTAELTSSLDSIQDGILFVANDHSVRAVNHKAASLFGAKVSTGDKVGAVARALTESGADAEFLSQWERLNNSEDEQLETRLLISNPVERSLTVHSSPVSDANDEFIGRVWAFYDVTESEALQQSLAHAHKQEAIGRVAAGFAHDFNNLLTGIIGSLSVMQLQPNQTIKQAEEQIDTALGAAERAGSLVSQLLGFSRKTRLNLTVSNVNDIVRQIKSLFEPSLGTAVTLELKLSDELPNVNVDETQLEQVLLNIFMNARDAMPNGGKVIVSTSTSVQCKPGSNEHSEYVVVAIRDTGSGIPADVRSKIFEPFFTTKVGKGTGLGLAMSEGIVQQHNGWIECDSSEDVGTEFRVFLPPTALQKKESAPSTKTQNEALSGKTVLIIDDEPLVRAVYASMFHQNGINVHTASGGQEGITILTDHVDSIDLVLLDWTMPGMSGKETLIAIKEAVPDVPTIICSGYVFDTDTVERLANVTPEAVIQKPFTPERILSEVDRVLHHEPHETNFRSRA